MYKWQCTNVPVLLRSTGISGRKRVHITPPNAWKRHQALHSLSLLLPYSATHVESNHVFLIPFLPRPPSGILRPLKSISESWPSLIGSICSQLVQKVRRTYSLQVKLYEELQKPFTHNCFLLRRQPFHFRSTHPITSATELVVVTGAISVRLHDKRHPEKIETILLAFPHILKAAHVRLFVQHVWMCIPHVSTNRIHSRVYVVRKI